MTTKLDTKNGSWRRVGLTLGLCLVLIAAAAFLWAGSAGRLTGALAWLPWLLILLCPVVHLLVHRRHGHGGGAGS